MGKFRVRFLPEAAEAWVAGGTTVLAAAIAARVAIDAPCGDKGICGKCRVQARAGLAPPTLAERSALSSGELHDGWRLACQARAVADVTAEVPERVLKPAVVPLSQIALRPNVWKHCVELPAPTIEDPASDLARLRRALPPEARGFQADLTLLRKLPQAMAANAHHVTAVIAGDRLIAVEPGDTTARCFGIAVDLGTTSVVVILADLVTGQALGIESLLNRQVSYGADVVSRIAHAGREPGGLRALQSAAVTTINAALARLLEVHGVRQDEVYEAVVAGNTCMHHILLGIDPGSLATAPYQPVVCDALYSAAAELGLAIHPEGLVYSLPNIAGFVGGDTVAVILATAMYEAEEPRLVLDLGTNGELVLGNRRRLLSCSTAAGPAFEGGRISCGMRATEGAIERVWIDGAEVKLQVIGGGRAIGVCGSGLADAVAQLLRAGLLSPSGRLLAADELDSTVPARLARRLVRTDGAGGFLLARAGRRAVVLRQRDVRELQLAKGAVRAGAAILLERYGLTESELAEILLAGAFGSFLSPASARAINLLPPFPADRITAVGNAAGTGALMALLSTDQRAIAGRVATAVEYVELAALPEFQERFVDALAFGEIT